ncbi:hypothetical protein WMF18_11485 [Sorangium sp. So ce315]|uniref:hypothetical protein n=1 Tax=Sorangium sp. So ce315 TaxID=3133299 RepID=UPI003F607713
MVKKTPATTNGARAKTNTTRTNGARKSAPAATASPPARSKAELVHRAALWDNVFSLARLAVQNGTYVACVYFLYLAVASLSGKSTNLAAVMSAIVDMKVNEWLAYVLAGVFGLGYWRERKLRQKTIESMGAHVRVLEGKIDSRRSTSGITTIGEPRKEDLDAV